LRSLCKSKSFAEALCFWYSSDLNAIKFRSSLFKELPVEGRALVRIFKGRTLKLSILQIENAV